MGGMTLRAKMWNAFFRTPLVVGWKWFDNHDDRWVLHITSQWRWQRRPHPAAVRR